MKTAERATRSVFKSFLYFLVTLKLEDNQQALVLVTAFFCLDVSRGRKSSAMVMMPESWCLLGIFELRF